MTREANSKADQSNTPEQQKKLQDKVEKCKQDVQKVRGTAGLMGHWAGETSGDGHHLPFSTIHSHFPIPVLPEKDEDLQAVLRGV